MQLKTVRKNEWNHNKADNLTIGAKFWMLFNLSLRILSFEYC